MDVYSWITQEIISLVSVNPIECKNACRCVLIWLSCDSEKKWELWLNFTSCSTATLSLCVPRILFYFTFFFFFSLLCWYMSTTSVPSHQIWSWPLASERYNLWLKAVMHKGLNYQQCKASQCQMTRADDIAWLTFQRDKVQGVLKSEFSGKIHEWLLPRKLEFLPRKLEQSTRVLT